jgi:hypothetical protein
VAEISSILGVKQIAQRRAILYQKKGKLSFHYFKRKKETNKQTP